MTMMLLQSCMRDSTSLQSPLRRKLEKQNRNRIPRAMRVLSYAGFLTQDNGEKEEWKVSNTFHHEANDKADGKAAEPTEEDCRSGKQSEQGQTGPLPEQQGKDMPASPDTAKKSFICKACDKSFHFYCRLKVHMKRCRVAKSKQVQCNECSETKDSKKELEKHQLEVHGAGGEPNVPKKKKKRLPVTCDLCGREFAHASGTFQRQSNRGW